MNFSDLLGKTIKEIQVRRDQYDDSITFTLEDDTQYKLHHHQDCCEGVDIEDINGDPQALVGFPLMLAEESTSEDKNADSATWTFYRLANMNAAVDIRWYGSSNGYYSESVDFCKLEDGHCKRW